MPAATDQPERTPIATVFISYSHDSKDHKQWVAGLAAHLRSNGIEVIFDQWDLEFGDDVPRFMTNAVTDADRVLMICTEEYVRKASEGVGGVGYEAMIVTSELVQRVGTKKFIPVVRQQDGRALRPKFVETRKYVNLSDGPEYQAELEALVRQILKEPPPTKPPLGEGIPQVQAPIASQPSALSTIVDTGSLQEAQDGLSEFIEANEAARSGDIKRWRGVVARAREDSLSALSLWRSDRAQTAIEGKDDLVDQTLNGISAFAPLMATGIAGVMSDSDRFENQTALVDDILVPKGWDRSGLVVRVELPEAAVFAYQAVHGAASLSQARVDLALRMARTVIAVPWMSAREPLWMHGDLVGWPRSLGDLNGSWKALGALPAKWRWIAAAFGSESDYRVAIGAYYMALNVFEFAQVTANPASSKRQYPWLEVPLFFPWLNEEEQRRSYRQLLQRPEDVAGIWRSLGVSDEQALGGWLSWIERCRAWQAHLHPFGIGVGRMAHSDLMQEVTGSPPQ